MAYSVETIKKDIIELPEKVFFEKYIVNSENWYFENVLGHSSEELPSISKRFREIISEELDVSTEDVMIVGSSQIGYSLSPYKLFSPFCINGEERKASDIDVAIVSAKYFERFWRLFRKNYSRKYAAYYRPSRNSSGIYCEIYRGFINEKSVLNIDECVRPWTAFCGNSKKKLQDHLFVQNEVTYRLYRRWSDFEEYNLKNIAKLKELSM